ncbi:MAG: hypothetical protein ABIA63_05290 [bacterium]
MKPDTYLISFQLKNFTIIDTFKVVLPYAVDLKTKITTDLDKKLYLSLSGKNNEPS